MSPDGLFPEQLIAAGGEVLIRHEIWRAVEKNGPEGIPVRGAHEYTFPLPPAPAGARQLTLRLMHRRYQDAFLDFLESDTGGLYTQAIEVLRRTIPWNPVPQADAQRFNHSDTS